MTTMYESGPLVARLTSFDSAIGRSTSFTELLETVAEASEMIRASSVVLSTVAARHAPMSVWFDPAHPDDLFTEPDLDGLTELRVCGHCARMEGLGSERFAFTQLDRSIYPCDTMQVLLAHNVT